MLPLDFFRDAWTEEDFKKKSLELRDGKIYLGKTAPSSPGGITGWFQGVREWAWQDPTSFFAVTKAMDEIAKSSLDSKSVTELTTLKANLQEHDKIISSYNTRFFGKVQCPTHEEAEKLCDQMIAKKLCEDYIRTIEKNLLDGAEIDRYNLPRIEAKFMPLWEKAGKPADLKQEYNRLVCAGYLQTLILRIKCGTLKAPPFVAALVNDPAKLEAGKQQLLVFLNTKLDKPPVEPSLLVDEVQSRFVELIAQNLPQDENTKIKLKMIHDFDIRLQQKIKRISQNIYALAKDAIKSHEKDLSPTQQAAVRLLFDSPQFTKSYPLDPFYLSILKNFEKLSPEELQKLLVEPKDIDTFFEKEVALKAKTIAEFKWFQAYEGRRLFRFCQADSGDNAMLGAGVCAALTYKWIKGLTENTTRKISQVSDLLPKGQIGAEDRFLQASHALGISFKSERQLFQPQLLAKDGFKEERLVQFSPINEGLNKIIALGDGFFELAIQSSESGHALGIQVDTAHSIWRFFDVNYGMYQFSSLDELKTAVQHYLPEVYPDFTHIYVSRISKLT